MNPTMPSSQKAVTSPAMLSLYMTKQAAAIGWCFGGPVGLIIGVPIGLVAGAILDAVLEDAPPAQTNTDPLAKGELNG